MKNLNLLIALFIQSVLFSQGSFHIIGTGSISNTTTAYPSVYGNWYRGARHQILIKASELQASGMSAGNISGIGFDVLVPSGGSLSNFEIELKSTTQIALSAWSNNNLQTCFGPTTINDVTGWNQHDFHTPFYWDGTSNIIVQTCFYSSGNSQNAIMNMSNYSYNTLIYRRRQGSSPCQNNWINGVETNRPNIRFEWINPSSPPITNFTSNSTSSCSGTVIFSDLTSNSPNSWLWDFGDGNTSTQQNPTHTYTATGTYDVQLISYNNFGSDTVIQNNLIQVNLVNTPPTPASCLPQTQIPGFGYGITEFQIGGIHKFSGNSSEGYSDFTCDSTLLYVGDFYDVRAVHESPSDQNFFMWIDLNNDGILDNNTELLLSNSNSDSTNSTIQIPSVASLNTPLRLRIMSDFFFSGNLDPCTNPVYGQAEDYTVYLTINTNPPAVDFNSNINYSCDGTVNFFDQSSNLPTAWYWDFGDGNSSIFQNPTHQYDSNGFYDVTLTVTNSYGTSSLTLNSYVEVDTSFKLTPALCTPSTLAYCCDYGINRVQFANINHPSADAMEGYVDFSCDQRAMVELNNNYALRVFTGSNNPQDTRAWIDYNDNGTFESNEMVMEKLNTFDPFSIVQIPSNVITNKALRLRISSDEVGSNNFSCDNVNRGQVEDYSIYIGTCPEPIFASVGAISNSSVQLSWEQGSNEPSWNIIYGPQGFGVLNGIGTQLNNIFTNNFFITGLNESTCYDFYIQSNCIGNTSDWHGPFNACTVGINENTQSENKIYPNPNSGRFLVESMYQIHKIEISNITGKIIYSEVDVNKKTKNIDLSMEQKGVYFVKVSLANKSIKTNSVILN